MRPGPLACRVLLALAALAAPPAAAQPLVTPVRVGRPDAPLTVRVWAQQDYSHLAASPATAEVFTGVFAAWARAHPDVQLEVSVMPALEEHKAKLLLAAAAGRLPDVASIDSFWLPLFLEGGHVQPLNEYWPEADRRDFLPFTVQTLSDARGHVYGLWHETDCRVLFHRTDLVPTPPETWSELLDVASRVARERQIAGYLYNAGRSEATVFDHLAMYWAQGGELVDAAGQPVFGLPPHREYLRRLLAFLAATIRTGASPRWVLSATDYDQLASAAIAGDVAMFLGGNWQLRELEAALSPSAFARWDVAPIPQTARGRQATGTGGWIWVVFARDPARRKAAAELIRFVEAKHNAARISAATGHLPVRRSVYREFPFFREDRWYARFGGMLVDGRARPAVPLYPTISDQLQLAIGAVVAGTKSPDRAIDDAWRAVRSEADRRAAIRAARPHGIDVVAWLPLLVSAALAIWVLGPLGGERRALRAWLGPAIALVALVLAYPMLELIRLSLTDARIGSPAYRYTFESFRGLLGDPEFYSMLGVTLVFVAGSVGLQLTLGLLLALLIDSARRRHLRGTVAARVAVVSAWVMPGVLVGLVWKILLVENRSGLATYWLSLAGVGPLPLLSSGTLALASVIVANTWRGCAFSMVLQYAGLQRVPRELHEAADLEGVRGWQRFRLVVLPHIAPVVVLNLVLITIYTLNTFDLILPLTGGGPARRTEVVSLFMYRSAFFDLEAGRAAAIAVVVLAINLALAWAVVRLTIGRTPPAPATAPTARV